MPDKNVDVLIVEDSEIDMMAVLRAFRKANITNATHKACDGVEALDMLRGTGGKPPLSQPCVVLLDINMPRMDGLTMLSELRNDNNISESIVFMLTTSGHVADRKAAYERNVAGYFLKENLAPLVEMLKPYCQANEFPV